MNRPDGYYKAILHKADLANLVSLLERCKELSFDTETSGVDYLTCDLYGISVSTEPAVGWYIPVSVEPKAGDQPSFLAPEGLKLETILRFLNPIFEDKNKIIIFHNAKFDLHVLKRHGFNIKAYVYDTMLGTWVLGNRRGLRYGLKTIASTKFNIDMVEFKEVAGKEDFSKVPIKAATEYAAADTDITFRLYDFLESIFMDYPELKQIADMEFRLIPVLARMEENGVLVNKEYLEEIKPELKKGIDKLHNEIVFRLSKNWFNLRSTGQLLTELKRNGFELTDTSESTLKTFSYQDEVFAKIIEYRKYEKIRGTYVDGILNKLNPTTNRLHTDFRQAGIVTGRLSSSAPNLQNLPAVMHYGLPSIRKAMVVPTGYKFFSLDYSQLEIRLVTHISQDETWLKAITYGEDIHTATAAIIFDKRLDEVTELERKKAKTINFALLYGTTPYGLAPRLGMSVKETEKFIQVYFSKLPGIRNYIETTKKFVEENKYVETVLGRRRYFFWDPTDDYKLNAVQREAVNAPIQGTAADIMKRAMIEVDKFLLETNSNTKMLIQVHDELDFEVPTYEIPVVIPEIKKIMEHALPLSVPLKVDVEYGDNWGELQEWVF